MRFALETTYIADADAVAAAYRDPALYAAFHDLPRAGRPEVLDHRVEGDRVHLRVRWRFTAQLSAAARRVIDPDKLTWVERSTHDAVARSATFELVADHYRDRFSCAGSYRFLPASGSPGASHSMRRTEGDLRIKALLVAGAVENAIVDGLKEQLRAEVAVVDAVVKG